MKTEPVESLMKKIIDQYDKRPDGWRVLTDWKGNVIILSPRVSYRLKLIPLNPIEYTGVGVKINGLDEIQRITEGVPFYGFRPLSEEVTRELLNTSHQRRPIQNKLIEKLLMMKTVSTRKLQKKGLKAVLTGPVIAHPNLNGISKSQRELEKKLTTEAYELFKKKYSYRAAIYR